MPSRTIITTRAFSLIELLVEVTGVSTHWGGRNRLLLDGHVESVRDPRVR